jgi:hydrogenase-4 component F
MTDLLALSTVAAPAVGGLLVLRLPPRAAGAVALIALLAGVLPALALAWSALDGPVVVALAGLVRLDALGAWLVVLVALVASVAVAASPRYLASELAEGRIASLDAGRYFALTLWFVACLLAVPLLDNLGLIWVAIEAATAVSTLLVGFYRTTAALEAAWKYLILGSVGIGFALLATVLLYASSVPRLGETSDALNWARLMGIASGLDPTLVRLSFLFALVGYGTKLGLAPFHTWLPDAHSQAPSPISALLSGVTLAVALYALVRFHLVTEAALGTGYSSLLLVALGLFSLLVALPFLVAQSDLKRLLAYSSIEHMGLLTLAIGFGGRLALLGAALHVMAHGLATATAFLAAGDIAQQFGTRRLGRLRGVLASSPEAGPGLLLSTLLAGGLPPSAVFAAEIAILVGGIQAGWTVPAAIAATLLALAFAAIAAHLVRVAWGSPRRRIAIAPRSASQAGLLFVPLATVVLFGVWTPDPVAHALDAVVRVLAGAHG